MTQPRKYFQKASQNHHLRYNPLSLTFREQRSISLIRTKTPC